MVFLTQRDRSEHTHHSWGRLYCHHQSVFNQMNLNLLTFEETTWAPSLAVALLGLVPQRRLHKDYLRQIIRNEEMTNITTTVEFEGSVFMLSLTLNSQLHCTK